MRKFRKWLQENNIAYETLELKDGIGILVKAENEDIAVEYLEESKTSCEYNDICNNEWILFKF